MQDKTAISIVKILTAATGWGLIGVFSRPLSAAGISALQLTFIRSVVVMAGIGLFLFSKDRSLFRIRLRDFWMFLGTGLVSIIFFNICYFTTIQHATLAAASMLLYTAPCFVMLMSALFFKEKITAQKLAALALAFAGCALVSGFSGGEITLFSLLTGIGSGFGYATYSIFGKVALEKYDTFTVIFYTFVVSGFGLLVFARPLDTFFAVTEEPSSLAAALGLGLVSTVMPYIFYTGGLKYVEAGKASVLAFAEPMVATVAGVVIFHETLHMKNAAGILLIFTAIVLLNIPLKKRSAQRTF